MKTSIQSLIDVQNAEVNWLYEREIAIDSLDALPFPDAVIQNKLISNKMRPHLYSEGLLFIFVSKVMKFAANEQ